MDMRIIPYEPKMLASTGHQNVGFHAERKARSKCARRIGHAQFAIRVNDHMSPSAVGNAYPILIARADRDTIHGLRRREQSALTNYLAQGS